MILWVNCWDDIEGRQFNVKVAEDAIKSLTTKLKVSNDDTISAPLEGVINRISNSHSIDDEYNANVASRVFN